MPASIPTLIRTRKAQGAGSRVRRQIMNARDVGGEFNIPPTFRWTTRNLPTREASMLTYASGTLESHISTGSIYFIAAASTVFFAAPISIMGTGWRAIAAATFAAFMGMGAALLIGSLRDRPVAHELILYSDAMLAAGVITLALGLKARKYRRQGIDPTERPEEMLPYAKRVAIFSVISTGILLGVEYVPIWS